MSIHTLFLVLAIHAVALISPGPDFAVVTRIAMISGRAAGLLAAAGVATAIGCYVLVCAFGLSVVVAALPMLSSVLTYAGAAYLCWLGIVCLRSKGQLPQAAAASSGGRYFSTGFLTNLLNPKAMLYFGAVLSQVFRPDVGVRDAAIVFVLLVTQSFIWFALVALFFSSRRVLQWLGQRLVWFDRAIGVVLLGMAAKLACSFDR